MQYLKLATATAFGVLLAATANAQSCVAWTNGSCNMYIPSPEQPSASKMPRENIEILLQRAKEEYKEADSKWVDWSGQRTKAKTKVDGYTAILKTLSEN